MNELFAGSTAIENSGTSPEHPSSCSMPRFRPFPNTLQRNPRPRDQLGRLAGAVGQCFLLLQTFLSNFRARFARPTAQSRIIHFLVFHSGFGVFRKSILKFLQYFWKIFIRIFFLEKIKLNLINLKNICKIDKKFCKKNTAAVGGGT